MSFLNTTDQGLVEFATPFSAQLTATPVPLGVSVPQAASLASDLSDYVAKLAASKSPATRGPATVLAKENSKKILIAEIRALARQIQGAQSVTSEQRQALGLTVRSAPTPIPAPADPPKTDMKSVVGRTVTIKVHDGSGTKRARPSNTRGVSVFTFTGATPPASVEDWTWAGSSGKTIVSIPFPMDLAPGSTVWITAAWVGTRMETGPACTPISVTFGAAGVTTAA